MYVLVVPLNTWAAPNQAAGCCDEYSRNPRANVISSEQRQAKEGPIASRNNGLEALSRRANSCRCLDQLSLGSTVCLRSLSLLFDRRLLPMVG